MRFLYCPICGDKLILKDIGDEGPTPYCEKCLEPRFDMFPSCVIVLVTNGDGQVVLLRQDYLSTKYRTLVSGYMKPGETAEEAAVREVKEETGLSLHSLRLIRTFWFDTKGMLMIAFIGCTDDTEFRLSGEVDAAEWVKAEDAIHMVRPKAPGVASYALVETYLLELEPKR